jgi:hypothetical protein
MSEQVAGSLDLYLKIGLAVSVQGKSEEEVAATVVSISPGGLELELSTPPSEPLFQEGEKVSIKYWDTQAVMYCWDAKVAQISGSDNQHVTISISGDVVVQRRKSHRVQSAVPFSFTVIEATEPQLKRLNVVGWVVRSELVQGEGKDLRSVAVMFLQLKAEEQSELLKFLAGAGMGG